MAVEYHLITWAGLGTAVTFTDAGDIVNYTAHGAPTGHAFQFPDNGNTLPPELSKNVTYYLREGADANKFTVYPTQADAIAGTNQITFSGTGTGTHLVVGAYWATLSVSGKARYGTPGSERVFAGMSQWHTYASAAENMALDKSVVVEFEGKWIDSSPVINSWTVTGNYSVLYTSRINGVRGSAFHNGVIGGGYVRSINNQFRQAIVLLTNQIVDGLEFINLAASGGAGIYINGAALATVKNCIASGYIGIISALSSTFKIYNNLVYSCPVAGYQDTGASGLGSFIYNNIVTKCGTGFLVSTGHKGSFFNNIAVGNTTNWGASLPSGYKGYNGGLSTDTIWGDNSITLTTDIFTDFTNNNFAFVGASAAGINAGLAFPDIENSDIKDAVRPNYESATYPNNLRDIGCYEFDHGEGLRPITVTFAGLQRGSTVRIFSTGTQTVAASTTNSDATYSPSGVGAAVYDYTIFKDGFAPIRVTGVTFSDGLTISGVQTLDRVYAASSGLTYGVNATVNTSTLQFGLTAASTGQNWYSFWCEQYRSNSDLYNKPFPLQANGPNSFTLRFGYEFDGTPSIANLSRDGIRYLDTSGTQTAAWAAILTVGVPDGMQVRYQQTDGGTTQDAATTGNMDHLIQIYGDTSHGSIDYTGYLVLKVQESGYDQAEADAVTLYGTLEDQLYVIGLSPIPNGVEAGDPLLANPPTITDHEGSPVTWNSKDFSITIEDSAEGNTGNAIMRWLRHYFEQGGVFQGKDAFNWHDLVQTNGSDFKTVRGKLYGDTGAALKGVRIIANGTADPHSDFNLFTADDGTTYVPPVVAAAEVTLLADSRVQLYNVTTATEIDNSFSASTAYSYTVTTEASVGDTLRLRVCKKGYQSAEAFGIWSTVGLTFLVTQLEDAIYSGWGIDGESVTEFSLDVTGTVEIDADDADGVTTKTRLAAWYNYALTTEDGIRNAFGAVTFLAANAIRINVDVLDLKIENINALTALRFTDNDVRLFRSDGTSIIAETSYSIHNDYTGVPDVSVVTVSGSNVITGDIAEVAGQVQSGLSAQGYSASRAGKLDKLDTVLTPTTAVEGTVTLEESIRVMLAVLAGKCSGGDSTTVTYRDILDTKNRIVATVDNFGNRTEVTVDKA